MLRYYADLFLCICLFLALYCLSIGLLVMACKSFMSIVMIPW